MTDEKKLYEKDPIGAFADRLASGLTESLQSAFVKKARESVEKTTFDVSDFSLLFSRLRDESETAQVLIFGSYLEDKIYDLIKAKLHDVRSKQIEDALFGSNGPFATFGSRIAIAYHLGWIAEEQKERLTAFRKIRNKFAHEAFKTRLADEDLASHLKKISQLDSLLSSVRASLDEKQRAKLPEDHEITTAQRYLCDFALLGRDAFVDLLLYSAARAYHVDFNSVAGLKDDEGPKVVKDVVSAGTAAVFNILKLNERSK